MATMSEVSQATVNGMNMNDKNHDSRVSNHDSPSKTTASLNFSDRLTNKTEVSKEKTPTPEYPVDQSKQLTATFSANEKRSASPAAAIIFGDSSATNNSTNKTTTSADPAGVVISAAASSTNATGPATKTQAKPAAFDVGPTPSVSEGVTAASGVGGEKQKSPPVLTPTAAPVTPNKPASTSLAVPAPTVARARSPTPTPKVVEEKKATDGPSEEKKQKMDVEMTDLTKKDEKMETEAKRQEEPKEEKSTSEDVVENADQADSAAAPTPKKTAGRKPGSTRKVAAAAASTPKKATTAEEASAEGATEASAVSPRRSASPRKKKGEAAEVDSSDKTPLLEAPLIIEGKRSRQKVERLDAKMLATPDKKELEIPTGKGQKLGDIHFVEAMISKTSANDLKTLHRILFAKVGTATEVKKNIRQFSGFGFDATSKDFEKKKKSIEHITMNELKSVCTLLGLEKGNKKEEAVEAILNFLVQPTDKGKKPPIQHTSKRSSRKRSAPSSCSSSTSKKRSTTKRGRGAKKSTTAAEATSEEESTAAEDEDEEEQQQEIDEQEIQQKDDSPAKKQDDGEPSAKKPKRGAKAATTPAPASAKKQQPSTSRSAKKSAFPSDADLKSTIKELLKGVNLEEVTMKEMTTKVYDKFPNVDLISKKDFIKETVKSLLSSND